MDEAEEPEDFQSIGMMCRETLIELVKSLQSDLPIPENQENPKLADFVHWSEIAILHFASGQRNQHIRGYLKTSAKETWHLVNWLTHTSKASLHEAHLALDATAHLLASISLAIMVAEADGPTTCPRCKSYRIVSVYEPDLGIDPSYVNLCESCGWNTYDKTLNA